MKKLISVFLASILIGGTLALSTSFKDKISTNEIKYITADQVIPGPTGMRFKG